MSGRAASAWPDRNATASFRFRATKVLPVPLPRLFKLATARQAEWFPKGAVEETSRTTDKYWRGKWKEDARVNIGFYCQGRRQGLHRGGLRKAARRCGD